MLTLSFSGCIITLVLRNEEATLSAGVAELADAQDLKSCDPFRSYRFDSDLRHHYLQGRGCVYYIVAGWSSLVARRAHNPEVVGSNPAPATKILSYGGVAQLARAYGSYP